jgi:predicted alpha/beta hydrolase family esterase
MASHEKRPLPPPPTQPPQLSRALLEVLSIRETVRLPLAALRLSRGTRGSGRPVLMVPGLGATDESMLPLRLYLRRLGHDARAAKLGRVNDDVDAQYQRVVERVERLAASSGDQVALVGWSIGGVLAREAARDVPGVVTQVITFGTPVVGGPTFSVVARRYDAATLRAIGQQVDERNTTPIRVPITAIWSRNDGIVDPAACIDRLSPNVENIEVSSTHFGMGLDPDVWHHTATRLAVSR